MSIIDYMLDMIFLILKFLGALLAIGIGLVLIMGLLQLCAWLFDKGIGEVFNGKPYFPEQDDGKVRSGRPPSRL